jgi:uncharacterized membrane protein
MPPAKRHQGLSAGQRVLVVMTVTVVAAVLAMPFAPWQLWPLVGWIAGSALFLFSVWLKVHDLTPEQTHAAATHEDDSRVAAELLLNSASIASLAGTGFALIKANQTDGAGKAALTVAALLTVFLSWGVVHTVFMLRYARLYYGHPVGGINFEHRAEAPDYRDFAYVAFTIGMTYQVSDTDIETRAIRRIVLRHALISYLFGAVIVAVTVNTIAGIFFK